MPEQSVWLLVCAIQPAQVDAISWADARCRMKIADTHVSLTGQTGCIRSCSQPNIISAFLHLLMQLHQTHSFLKYGSTQPASAHAGYTMQSQSGNQTHPKYQSITVQRTSIRIHVLGHHRFELCKQTNKNGWKFDFTGSASELTCYLLITKNHHMTPHQPSCTAGKHDKYQNAHASCTVMVPSSLFTLFFPLSFVVKLFEFLFILGQKNCSHQKIKYFKVFTKVNITRKKITLANTSDKRQVASPRNSCSSSLSICIAEQISV